MPPCTPAPPVPTGRGRDAAAFLSYHGLVPRTCPIRSSCYESGLSNPFIYYLTRRLGLARPFDSSTALTRGSWTHTCLELDPLSCPPAALEQPLHAVLKLRLDELKTQCESQGIVGDSLKAFLDRETKDALSALAWYQAASSVTITPQHRDFRTYLSRDHWVILGHELKATYLDPSFPKTPLVGVYDLLLYHRTHNTLWVLDLKTCSESPVTRLATCPIEFQTQHYLHILRELVRSGVLQAQFNLPADVQPMGMIHLAIQKPTIEFGQLDRSFREVPFTPKTGKNKGITRMEKEFYGEPTLSNYFTRCRHWYNATDDYTHLAPARATPEVGPPVNLSFSPITSVLDADGTIQYTSRLKYIEDLARREATPENFLVSASDLRSFGSLSPWAPFALCPVKHWPEIMQREGFIVSFRDEDTPHEPGLTHTRTGPLPVQALPPSNSPGPEAQANPS